MFKEALPVMGLITVENGQFREKLMPEIWSVYGRSAHLKHSFINLTNKE